MKTLKNIVLRSLFFLLMLLGISPTFAQNSGEVAACQRQIGHGVHRECLLLFGRYGVDELCACLYQNGLRALSNFERVRLPNTLPGNQGNTRCLKSFESRQLDCNRIATWTDEIELKITSLMGDFVCDRSGFLLR